MRVLLLLAHRLHVRNMVASGLTRRLVEAGHRLTIVAPALDWIEVPLGLRQGVEFLPAGNYAGSARRGRLRRVLMLGTMVAREHQSRTMAHKLAYEGRSRLQIAGWRALRRVADLEQVARGIEGRLRPSEAAQTLINTVRPDVLLWPTTFAQPNEELEVVTACRRAGVPILALPASWDTLTSKPSALVRPDRLLVWGEASAGHARRLGYADREITVTGPPHWDCYGPPPAWNSRLMVLVAGTSLHFWADEAQVVYALQQAARGAPWRVLYRPHPSRLKDPAFTPPSGVEMDERLGYDLQPGFQEHLRDRLQASVCVVAAFSTLIVEAALMGVPSFVPAFAQSQKGPFGVLDHGTYDYMAEVVAWPGVQVVPSLAGLLDGVRLAGAGTLAYDPSWPLRRQALGIARVGGAQARILHAVAETT